MLAIAGNATIAVGAKGHPSRAATRRLTATAMLQILRDINLATIHHRIIAIIKTNQALDAARLGALAVGKDVAVTFLAVIDPSIAAHAVPGRQANPLNAHQVTGTAIVRLATTVLFTDLAFVRAPRTDDQQSA